MLVQDVKLRFTKGAKPRQMRFTTGLNAPFGIRIRDNFYQLRIEWLLCRMRWAVVGRGYDLAILNGVFSKVRIMDAACDIVNITDSKIIFF